ncbi:hypothetical protein CDAR_110861 [Caerostris darwini]|uniref:Uncharacterized protein n=1 Tax=Caerostris darwini TaxID=1538125 RepID=A0AAV4QU17_9ARAC|nr:hypothetical protein CDAR_110861 [Caerostris darwini]
MQDRCRLAPKRSRFQNHHSLSPLKTIRREGSPHPHPPTESFARGVGAFPTSTANYGIRTSDTFRLCIRNMCNYQASVFWGCPVLSSYKTA